MKEVPSNCIFCRKVADDTTVSMGYENNKILLLLVFTLAFILNLIWENAQAPLYLGYESFFWHFLPCLQATLFDAFFVLTLFLLYSNLKKRMGTNIIIWIIIFVIGLGVAAFIEYRAIYENRWQYSEAMPTIFLIGIFPLLQLSVTTAMTIVLFNFLRKRIKGK